ncbi:MAG: hypothetical protein ACI4WT_13110 [Oligosphaeraceae bacterium]
MTTPRRTAILLPLLVLAAWLALAAGLPPRHELRLAQPWPARPEAGQPLRLELITHAPLPPPDIPELSGLPDGLLLAKPTTTRLDGLGWRGPRWRQTLSLIVATLAPIPATTLSRQDARLALPALAPQLPLDLPDEPPPPPPIPHTTDASRTWLPLAVLAALALAATPLWLRQRPRRRLRRLQPTPNCLDQLPDLLAQQHPPITRASAPDLFRDLDALRFAPTPPSPQDVQRLLARVRQRATAPPHA